LAERQTKFSCSAKSKAGLPKRTTGGGGGGHSFEMRSREKEKETEKVDIEIEKVDIEN
jgi:hypothetical protein